MHRRDFLKRASAAGAAGLTVPRRRAVDASAATVQGQRDARSAWLRLLGLLAEPVLTHLAAGTLKARMPVEQAAGADRAGVTHLEALGRLLAGIAPWLELAADGSDEARTRERYQSLARAALARAVDPASPDFLNFVSGGQPLVDAAFLAQAILRAPGALDRDLDPEARRQLITALESTRATVPPFNNWLLFSATVEAALRQLGARWDAMRVDYALRQHEQWYVGDGAYGDGPAFHWDYYNSFVIQPMLVDVLAACGDERSAWQELQPIVEERATRYAAVLERLIAPDGSFPAVGRSIAYRCGAFQALAQAGLRHRLPESVAPSQAREALTAVLSRTLEAPGTFDAEGWLTIGLCGHQPGVGEQYISTGSLYLCATALLPLGLPGDDEFWSGEGRAWTSRRAWNGDSFQIDHALDTRRPSWIRR